MTCMHTCTTQLVVHRETKKYNFAAPEYVGRHIAIVQCYDTKIGLKYLKIDMLLLLELIHDLPMMLLM